MAARNGIELDPGNRLLSQGSRSTYLSKQRFDILWILWEAYPTPLPIGEIALALYQPGIAPPVEAKGTVRTQLGRLRDEITRAGIELAIPWVGNGYKLGFDPQRQSADARPEVLLVEDNADDAELVGIAFKRVGLDADLVLARSLGEAWDKIIAGPPALVILDLGLGPENGITLVRDMRKHAATRVTPIIVWSGTDSDREKRESLEAGANCFVAKPRNYEAHQHLIRETIRFWLGTATLPSNQGCK